MSGRKATGEVYTKLVNQGPKQIEHNENITNEMKEDGVRKFNPSSRSSGGSLPSGRTSPVYYIEGKHEPESIIRNWLDLNSEEIAHISTKALHIRIISYGEAFKPASKKVFKERGEWEMAFGEPNTVTDHMGGECPFCETEFFGSLASHLPCEESP